MTAAAHGPSAARCYCPRRFGREELALIDMTLLRLSTAFMGASGSSFSRFAAAGLEYTGLPALFPNMEDACFDLLQQEPPWGSAPLGSGDSWGWSQPRRRA